MEVNEYLSHFGLRLRFHECHWMPGMELPTLLPARTRRSVTLSSVHGNCFIGTGEGDRIYVLADQHRRAASLGWPRSKVTCVLESAPTTLFYVRLSQYTIG
jgi:hypothetical protein